MPLKHQVPITSVAAPPAVVTLKGDVKIKVQLRVDAVYQIMNDDGTPMKDEDGRDVYNADLGFQLKLE